MIIRLCKFSVVARVLVLILVMSSILAVTGCVSSAAAMNGTPENAVQLTGIPQDAELEYTYTSNKNYGILVTTDIWNHTEDTGFFVLEFRCDSGSLQQAELRRATGDTVANFGNIQENGIFITDIVTEAAGDYILYFEKSDYYDGEISVYFVSGIGYSLAE